MNRNVAPAVPTCHIYGIKNCSTMKKAFAWCEAHGVAYVFHDVRKEGLTASRLEAWCRTAGWQALVNRRGTTWRALPPARQAVATQAGAVALMRDHPALIRRPVIETAAHLLVGFDPALYERHLR